MSDSLVARLSPTDFEQVAKLVLPAPTTAGSPRARPTSSRCTTTWPRSGAGGSTPRSWSTFGRSTSRPRSQGVHDRLPRHGRADGPPEGCRIPRASSARRPVWPRRARLFVEAVNATTTHGGHRTRHSRSCRSGSSSTTGTTARRSSRSSSARRTPAARASCRSSTPRPTSAHTPARVGYRGLPAGVTFAHFESALGTSTPASPRNTSSGSRS